MDTSKHYTVKGYRGVAFYFVGYAKRWVEGECWQDTDEDGEGVWFQDEGEEIEDTDRVIMVMVGDDYKHTVDADDITVIPEDGFCRDCGQIGCTSNTYT